MSKLVRQLTRIIDNNSRNPRQESDFMLAKKNESENSELQKIPNMKNKLKQLKSKLNVTRKKKTKQYSKSQPKKPSIKMPPKPKEDANSALQSEGLGTWLKSLIDIPEEYHRAKEEFNFSQLAKDL